MIGIPDERWQERPLAAVVRATEADAVGFDVIAKDLMERVPRWWIPTHWVAVESIPRTSLGKIDKKKMRELYQKGLLGNVLILE